MSSGDPTARPNARQALLQAVAEHGFEAVAGRVVHHISQIPFDNRPENLEVLNDEDHKEAHIEEFDRSKGGVFAGKAIAGKGTTSGSSRANLGDPQ